MTLTELKEYLDDYYDFDIALKCRKTNYVRARCMYYELAKYVNSWNSLETIGAVVKRDHATVLHGYKTFNSYFVSDESFRITYDNLFTRLESFFSSVIEIKVIERKELQDLKTYYTDKIKIMQDRINQLENAKHNTKSNIDDFKPLFLLSDSDILEFKETRLKPYLNMIKTRRKHKDIKQVAGAMLRM
tara:strand:- start:389 stop:952 length:564 start_codon:yes stop_codon:yes gene_type:complete